MSEASNFAVWQDRHHSTLVAMYLKKDQQESFYGFCQNWYNRYYSGKEAIINMRDIITKPVQLHLPFH